MILCLQFDINSPLINAVCLYRPSIVCLLHTGCGSTILLLKTGSSYTCPKADYTNLLETIYKSIGPEQTFLQRNKKGNQRDNDKICIYENIYKYFQGIIYVDRNIYIIVFIYIKNKINKLSNKSRNCIKAQNKIC